MDPSNPQPDKKKRDDDGGDVEYQPRWPQRPSSRGAGLDPAGADGTRPRPSTDSSTISPWTATPTHYSNSDPNETVQFPSVDRFGARRLPQPQDRSPNPERGVASQPPTVGRPVSHQSHSSFDETRIAGVGDLDKGINHSRYSDETQLYTPAQRPNPAIRTPQPASRNKKVQPEENYIDPRVDPRHIMREDRRARRAGRKGRYKWLLWSAVGLFAILLMSAVAFTLAWQGQYAGKIYAGVVALDINLGGKTPDEAKKLLREKVAAFAEQPVTLAWAGREWRPRGEQIGLLVNVDATVDEAFGVGRGSDFFGGISQQWLAAQAGYVVPLQVQLSEPVLQQYLQTNVTPEIDQALFEGDVRLDGARVVALPGKEGRQLKVYDTIVAVREQLGKLEPARLNLTVETLQPVVSAEEVRHIEEQLSIRISSPITATAHSKTFTLDSEALVRFTTIERNPDRLAQHHLNLGWKESELQNIGERWAKEAKRPPQDARFAWQGGSVAVLTESIDGFETEPDAVVASIKQHTSTPDNRIYELPGKVLTPTISSKDLSKIGIQEKLGTGTSTFQGSSAERATNIRVAANLLNGSVVPPGGTFSFLSAMGGIDEAHGFVEGYVIAAERTQRGVGGGVCQVSTTAFRAAFWSGLDLVERHQHSYRVSWYEANGEPVGFDAAVFDPGVDLQWTNNTPGYLLIEAVAGSDSVTVNVYGTKIANEVKLEGPVITNRVSPPPDVYEVDSRLQPDTKKQVETARGGLDTTITRRIITTTGEEKIDQFRSSYKAWPNWYVVASPAQIPGNKVAPTPTPNP